MRAAWGGMLMLAAARSLALEPLPNPLTLEAALRLAQGTQPELLAAEAAVRAAEAERIRAEARTGLSARAEARLRWVQNPLRTPEPGHDDHRLGVVLRKTLYDFGRSEAAVLAAGTDVEARRWLLAEVRQRQVLAVMQAYFDVLLADMAFYRDNEDMSVKYVRLDRLRDRRELGQVSDLEVLEQEARYQESRRRRYRSQHRQRLTRTRLAEVLNRPDDVPADLEPPRLDFSARKLEEVEVLQRQALENNFRLRALRARLRAARARLAEARRGLRPELRGEAEAFTYSRLRGSGDEWRVGVILEYPLADGGLTDAAVARAQAEVFSVQAELARLEREVRLAVLDLWLELDALRVRRDEARTEVDYRELYLDRSRALYEMEVRTDLGDAMTRITDAQLKAMEVDLRTALAWARLDALRGRLVPQPAAGGEAAP